MELLLVPKSAVPHQSQFAKPKFESVKGFKNWANQQCELNLRGLIEYNDHLRGLAVELTLIAGHQRQKEYGQILDHIAKTIFPLLNRYDLLECDEEWSLTKTLLTNISNLIPSKQSLAMLVDFLTRIVARRKQLERLHVVRKEKAAQS